MCPYYMSMGMSFDDFWNGDSSLVRYYAEAQKYRLEQSNYEMWLLGVYMCSAIQSTVGNYLSDKKSKKNKYLEEPIMLREKTDAELRRDAEKEKQKALESFNRLKKAIKSTEDK